MNCIGWKYTRSFFGPFDKADMIAVKAILNTGTNGLLLVFQAV